MSITTMIERIIGKQRERQAADFRGLVVQIADGKEPDAEFVAQVLRDADKTVDELQQAVELLRRRRQWRQQYDRLPGLADERTQVERQIAAADAVLEAAQKEYERVIHPLCFRMQDLRDATSEAEKAERQLWATCTDPELLDKLADVQTRLSQVRQEAGDLRRQTDNLRERAKSDRAEAEQQRLLIGGDRQAEAYLERAKGHERQVVELEVVLAKANKIVSSLEREETAIRQEMLVP
jgi:chromosome segregation ATPase